MRWDIFRKSFFKAIVFPLRRTLQMKGLCEVSTLFKGKKLSLHICNNSCSQPVAPSVPFLLINSLRRYRNSKYFIPGVTKVNPLFLTIEFASSCILSSFYERFDFNFEVGNS